MQPARHLRNFIVAAEAPRVPDGDVGPLAFDPVAQLCGLPTETPLLLQQGTHPLERGAGLGCRSPAVVRRPPGQRGPRGLQCVRVMDVSILHCTE